jgi:hypothetical protein
MYAELTIDQGATFSSTLDLTNDDNTPMNVANTTFAAEVRKSYYSTNATANLVVTVEGDAANGRIRMGLDAANTANIKPGRYLYDLKMTSNANVSIRIVEGILTVTPQVTR